jgi:hypothetical protein
LLDWLHAKQEPNSLIITDDATPFITKRVRLFDPEQHHFNPLVNATPERAVDLADIIYAADPGGENTLTVRNGKRALAKLLVNTTRLDKLHGDKTDLYQAEAMAAVDALLFFPLLKTIWCSGKPFNFKGTVVARIDRALLGPKQSIALALMLISQQKGQVVLLDGGFYLRPLHVPLIWQDRLTCSVRSLKKLPDEIRDELLMVKDKEGHGCTHVDAVELASYAGKMPHTDGHDMFVRDVMGLMER